MISGCARCRAERCFPKGMDTGPDGCIPRAGRERRAVQDNRREVLS